MFGSFLLSSHGPRPTHSDENQTESAGVGSGQRGTAKVGKALDEVRSFPSLIWNVRFEPICARVLPLPRLEAAMSYKIAGIDVHKRVLMVVVMDASTPEEKPERRRFTIMPSDLHRLSIWLREQGVEEAVMESTAQYWRTVWLE